MRSPGRVEELVGTRSHPTHADRELSIEVHAVCGSSSGLVDLSCDRDCGLRVRYVGYRGSVRVASALFEHNIKSQLPSCGRCGEHQSTLRVTCLPFTSNSTEAFGPLRLIASALLKRRFRQQSKSAWHWLAYSSILLTGDFKLFKKIPIPGRNKAKRSEVVERSEAQSAPKSCAKNFFFARFHSICCGLDDGKTWGYRVLSASPLLKKLQVAQPPTGSPCHKQPGKESSCPGKRKEGHSNVYD
ncbi:isoleucine--tRNA ligase [Striga asiatica]|uniref:Isoleucine--tRNA ligase n=1 Tax=Striga asiatica TaxID=4170 RepID=A0A5A7QS09_STRAF|nr:isoleucine--tRNA ligase [Striga asiatica]